MTDSEIKELVDTKLLRNISDYAIQTVLRRVLYYDKNHIDWQDFYKNMKQQMPELTLMGESKYIVTFVNSNDTSSHAEVEANSEKEARKKVKELYGREVYRVISAEKIAESAVRSAVNKILEGVDVRDTIVQATDETPKTRYAVVWDDEFPSTFYDSREEAFDAVKRVEDEQGTSGRIMTLQQYLNSDVSESVETDGIKTTDISKWNDFSLNQVGRRHYNYSSLEELKADLEYYGLPMSLADFDIRKFNKNNGYIKNDYHSWSALAYPPM